MDEQKPIQDGASVSVPRTTDAPPIEPGQLWAESLSALQAEFAFFTPGILQTFTHLDRDIIATYTAAKNLSTSDGPIIIDCVCPLFQDFPKNTYLPYAPGGQLVDWNRRLYMVPRTYWDDLREYVCRVVVRNPAAKLYAEIGWHTVNIIDVPLLRSGKVLDAVPFVEICNFSVSSNYGLVYLVEAVDPPRTLPRPVRTHPDPAMVAMGTVALGLPKSGGAYAR